MFFLSVLLLRRRNHLRNLRLHLFPTLAYTHGDHFEFRHNRTYNHDHWKILNSHNLFIYCLFVIFANVCLVLHFQIGPVCYGQSIPSDVIAFMVFVVNTPVYYVRLLYYVYYTILILCTLQIPASETNWCLFSQPEPVL